MNKAIKSLLTTLLHQKYIGGKHTPENKLIKSRTKYLTKDNRKEFEKDYRELVKNEIILCQKKRTKKGYDWHICLNPRKLKELKELLDL